MLIQKRQRFTILGPPGTQRAPKFHAVFHGVPLTGWLGWSSLGHFVYVRERPPGWIQHVLTVLVFWSWAPLRPRLPPLSRSLRLFPWTSILLHGPLGNFLDLLSAAPLPNAQKWDAEHKFLYIALGGHTLIMLSFPSFSKGK